VVLEFARKDISRCFWTPLRDRSLKKNIGVKEIGKRLGLNPTTAPRWEKGITNPIQHFFVALTMVIQENIQDVPLPSRLDVLHTVARRIVEHLRVTVCGKPERELTPEAFTMVRRALRHPNADSLIPEAGDKSIAEDVASHVVTWTVRKLYPDHVRTEATFRRLRADFGVALHEWADPYTLFYIGQTEKWKGFDVDQI